jgi:formylglycine-generating enzyme required for sulfatase activity
MSRRILDDRIELEDFVFDSLDALDSMTFKLEAGDYEAQCLNSSYGATYVLAVAGINQQTGNTELAPFVSNNFDYEYGNSGEEAGSQLVKNWPDGYYKIEIRQYLTSGGTALSHIVGPGEYTNCHTKTMYWNKSPLRCMVYVAPGSFMMGSPVSEYGHVEGSSWTKELLHKVTLSKAMYVQRTLLTTKEFGLLMAKIDGSVIHRYAEGYIGNGTLTAANYYNTTSSTLSVSHMPMQQLSWQDIMWDPDAYGDGYPYDITNSYYHTNGKCLISRLNSGAVSGFSVEGFTWNLPTEAQWEYAARAGTNTALPSGQNLNYPTSLEGGSDSTLQSNLNRVGWYSGNAGALKTVGLKMPNRWGLFDVVGNQWEWCQDLYGASYLKTPVENPANLNYTSTGSRVRRGGSCDLAARYCRCGHRLSGNGSTRYANYGSRLCLLQL